MRSTRQAGKGAPKRLGDNLAKISHVGAVVANRLADAGIETYTDVANSTPGELAAVLVGLPAYSAQQIDTWDWIGQARRLESMSVAVAMPSAAAESASDDTPAMFEVVRLGRARIRPLDHALGTDQPTAVGLELRPGPGSRPAPTLDYSAEINARRLDADGEVPIVRMKGVLRADRGVSHAASGPSLKAGLYRIVATISIYPAGHRPNDAPAWSDIALGDLVQVAAPAGQARGTGGTPANRHSAGKRLLADGLITQDEYAELTAGSR